MPPRREFLPATAAESSTCGETVHNKCRQWSSPPFDGAGLVGCYSWWSRFNCRKVGEFVMCDSGDMPIQRGADQPGQSDRQHVENAGMPAAGLVHVGHETVLAQIILDIF